MTIKEKIKEMFDAVFEPREEFMSLSKSSQDLLIGTLMDDIIEGFEALRKDVTTGVSKDREKDVLKR